MNARLPLRERKKAKVRESLIRTSFRLFSTKGYAETTLEEIADDCDVTVQTLLRYFGSKDDLLFANHPRILQRFSRGIGEAAKRNESLDFWIKFLRAGASKVKNEREISQTYKIIIGVPSLLARFYAFVRQYQALLEKALCEEQGVEPGEDAHARLLALLIVMGPIEEAFRVIAEGNANRVLARVTGVAQYVREHFPRPETATEPPRRSRKGAAHPPASLAADAHGARS